MITLDSVTRRYGDFTAVDDVSFTAEPGRVTGFLTRARAAGSASTMVGVLVVRCRRTRPRRRAQACLAP